MLCQKLLRAASIVLAAGSLAQAQPTLFTIFGDEGNDFFGSAVADAGDVDGDGVHDFVVGAPLHGKTARGYVRVYSGANGSVLAQWNGEAVVDWFGFAVSGAGDVNHDGHADLLVGAPKEANGTSIGTVRLFSGKDGSTLFEIDGATGDPQGDWFGYA
ncbi:MAG: integrin alpha [Planctomycetota bacterium]